MRLLNASIKKVLKTNKKIVCFGAGRTLVNCCSQYSDLSFVEQIDFILDNRVNNFEWCGRAFPVYTPEQFLHLNIDSDNVLIIITALSYPEIYNQLHEIDELSNTYCYIYPLMVYMPEPYELPKPTPLAVKKIPKIIHYTWFGNKDIPDVNRNWMSSWSEHCPDYEIIRWDESNYDVNRHQYTRDAYKSEKYAFVSDFARLEIVYNHGGIYLDCDVEVLKNLDLFLYDDVFCGLFMAGVIADGLGFGAVKGSNVIKEFLDSYDSISFFDERGVPDLTAQDKIRWRLLERQGLSHENNLQLINGVRVYPTDVFCPLDRYGNPVCFSKNTATIHHYDRSWMDASDAIKAKDEGYAMRNFLQKYPFESE